MKKFRLMQQDISDLQFDINDLQAEIAKIKDKKAVASEKYIKNNKIKICIDAGHYGLYNRSPVVKEYYESIMSWKLHLYLKEELENYGFEVITTRDRQDKDLEVYERGKKAEGCDLFISLHSNACNYESVDRVSVFHSFDNLNNSAVLGQKFADEVASVMNVSYGKLATRESEEYPGREYYGVLRGARKVGCPLYYIIEHSFHTNRYAATWLLDDNNLRKLAISEAKIIADYFNIQPKFKLLDKVKIKPGVTTYYNGKKIPSWVLASDLYVRKINEEMNTITISVLKEGDVTGTVFDSDLILIEPACGNAPVNNNTININLNINLDEKILKFFESIFQK